MKVNTLSELLSIEQAKEYILFNVTINGFKQFIQNHIIPLRIDCNCLRTRTLICDGTLGFTIYYNPEYFELLSNAGRILALFHEYMHAYLNSDNHVSMLNNLEYQIFLRILFPNMPYNFYEKIQYAGCNDVVRAYKNNEIRKNIRDIINETIYKKE